MIRYQVFEVKILFQIILFLYSKEKTKELSFCHKLKLSNLYLCNLMVYILYISSLKTIWSRGLHGIKYRRSTTSDCKDIVISTFRVCDKKFISYYFNQKIERKTRITWNFPTFSSHSMNFSISRLRDSSNE